MKEKEDKTDEQLKDLNKKITDKSYQLDRERRKLEDKNLLKRQQSETMQLKSEFN